MRLTVVLKSLHTRGINLDEKDSQYGPKFEVDCLNFIISWTDLRIILGRKKLCNIRVSKIDVQKGTSGLMMTNSIHRVVLMIIEKELSYD